MCHVVSGQVDPDVRTPMMSWQQHMWHAAGVAHWRHCWLCNRDTANVLPVLALLAAAQIRQCNVSASFGMK